MREYVGSRGGGERTLEHGQSHEPISGLTLNSTPLFLPTARYPSFFTSPLAFAGADGGFSRPELDEAARRLHGLGHARAHRSLFVQVRSRSSSQTTNWAFCMAGEVKARSLWVTVTLFLSPLCAKEEVPSGANLNWYIRGESSIIWHCDSEFLVRPTEVTHFIGTVEFKVCRREQSPSPLSCRGSCVQLDIPTHSGCPIAGGMWWAPSTGAHGLAELGPQGESKMTPCWLEVFLFVSLAVLLLCAHLDWTIGAASPWRSELNSLSSRGRSRWVGGKRWRPPRRRGHPKKVLLRQCWDTFGKMVKTMLVFKCKVLAFFNSADTSDDGRDPLPLAMMCIRWSFPILRRKHTVRPRFSFWVI